MSLHHTFFSILLMSVAIEAISLKHAEANCHVFSKTPNANIGHNSGSRRIPTLGESISNLELHSGRLGPIDHQISTIQDIATRIGSGEMGPYEGIAIEHFDFMRAILNFNFGWDTNFQLFESLSIRYDIILTSQSIQGILRENPERFESYLRYPMITNSHGQSFVLPRTLHALDSKRHGVFRDHTVLRYAEDRGFIPAPHMNLGSFPQRRHDSYLPPGSHLIGLETLIEVFEPDGIRFIHGTLLGAINDRWDILVLREEETGEEIFLSAHYNSTHFLHKHWIKPGPNEHVTLNEFEAAFAPYHVRSYIGDMGDWLNFGVGRQAFYVEYPGFEKVIVGRADPPARGASEPQFIVHSVDGHTYFFNRSSLRAYTISQVPEHPVSYFLEQ